MARNRNQERKVSILVRIPSEIVHARHEEFCDTVREHVEYYMDDPELFIIPFNYEHLSNYRFSLVFPDKAPEDAADRLEKVVRLSIAEMKIGLLEEEKEARMKQLRTRHSGL